MLELGRTELSTLEQRGGRKSHVASSTMVLLGISDSFLDQEPPKRRGLLLPQYGCSYAVRGVGWQHAFSH